MSEASKFKTLETAAVALLDETRPDVARDELLLLAAQIFMSERESTDDEDLEDFQNLAEGAYHRSLELLLNAANAASKEQGNT
jgi:hypothetical protein